MRNNRWARVLSKTSVLAREGGGPTHTHIQTYTYMNLYINLYTNLYANLYNNLYINLYIDLHINLHINLYINYSHLGRINDQKPKVVEVCVCVRTFPYLPARTGFAPFPPTYGVSCLGPIKNTVLCESSLIYQVARGPKTVFWSVPQIIP